MKNALWIVVGLALVGLAAAWWFFGRGAATPPAPGGFDSADVAVDSSDIRLRATDVRGDVQGDLMRWSCRLECLEPDGCRADIVVKVFYRTPSGSERVAFDGTIDVDNGGVAGVGGVQRPPAVVESIDRVEVTVRRFFEPGNPTPVAFQ